MSPNVFFGIFLHLECIQRLSNIYRGCGSQRSTDKVNWNIIFWAGCVIYHKIILNQQKLCLSSNINRIQGCMDDHFVIFNQWKSGWDATNQSQVKKLTKTFIPYTFQYLTMCHSLYLYSLALQQHWKKCTFIFVGDEILFLENCHFRAEHNILLSLSYVTKDLCLRTYVNSESCLERSFK